MILYRDTTTGQGPRTPSWLDGCQGIYRIQAEGGEILCLSDPIYVPRDQRIAWKDLGDGWQVAQVGTDPEVNQWIRQRPDMQFSPIKDAKGRAWVCPRILDEKGLVALALPWGKNSDGVRSRCPTASQSTLISIAEAARTELEANRLLETPLEVIASWVYPLLECSYFLSADVLDALALCDDQLGVNAILVAVGVAS